MPEFVTGTFKTKTGIERARHWFPLIDAMNALVNKRVVFHTALFSLHRKM